MAADGPPFDDDSAEATEEAQRAAIEEGAGDPGRSLWHGLISLAILVALVVGLLLAVPGLHGVAHEVSHMKLGWVLAGVGLEILSCIGYVIAFLQVFERAPIRFGARVALSELVYGARVRGRAELERQLSVEGGVSWLLGDAR